jgi:glycosyltransferase involved in cell wall biosynthesis
VKIAFIVQRYGTEILGGSEYHCRLVAERLAEHHQVDVLTTCARDYITWENVYPEGTDRIRGVTVRRFANATTRDLESFNQYSDWIFNNKHTRADEMEWLKQQGPWSPALIDYLERQHQAYDILIFFTYLYAPTVMGLRIAPSKSLLVPTAHDEPAIRLGIYEDVFSSAAGIVWNTDAERRFVSEHFSLRALVEDVVGCGVDVPESRFAGTEAAPTLAPVLPTATEALPAHIGGPANAFRRRHRLHEPFALYGGRIDPGKGCEELLEYFQAFLGEGGDATLLLMGVKLMPLPDDPHVRFAGILPDEERLHALEAATVVVVPSPHESLSLLALEAFAVGTPVLANARSEVLVDHCRRSHAGLFYEDLWEFIEALKLLMKDERLRAGMGRNGKAYVNRHYRWDIILTKYERMMTRLRQPQRDPRESRGPSASDPVAPRRSSPAPGGSRSGGQDRQDRRPGGKPDGRQGGKPDGRQGGRPQRSGRPGDRRQRPR